MKISTVRALNTMPNGPEREKKKQREKEEKELRKKDNKVLLNIVLTHLSVVPILAGHAFLI
jgi:hypothetical protein